MSTTLESAVGGTSDVTKAGHRPFALVPCAWALALVASALPLILARELSGSTSMYLPAIQAAALAAAWLTVRRSPSLRPLETTVRWLLCLAVGWHVIVGAVTGSTAWAAWQPTVPWIMRGAVVQVLLLIPTVLMVIAGPARRSLAALRMRAGDDRRPAGRDVTTLGKTPSWRRFGAFWAAGVTLGTVTAMTIALPPGLDNVGRLLVAGPVIAVLAATNTVNEELQFRNVPFAHLPTLVGRGHALLITATVFGLEHYYGNPPAASGVLLAGFLGYVLGKSMLETGGSRWAWAIHWMQDVVIFTALTLSWPT